MFGAPSSQEELWRACATGTVDEVRLFITEGACVSERDDDGYAPLHLAVRRESEEEIEMIIDVLVISGCDLNQITFPKGNTTLHLVVENATNEAMAVNIVSKLMIYKADQTLRNRDLRTPYDIALARGYLEVAALFDGSIRISDIRKLRKKRQAEEYGKLLLPAVKSGDLGAVRTCLEKGADVNCVSDSGAGALHYAVTHCPSGKEAVLKTLLLAGARINLLDKEGDNVLNLVIKQEQLHASGEMARIVRLLLSKGAMQNYRDLDGKNAWDLADGAGYDDIKELLQPPDRPYIPAEVPREAAPETNTGSPGSPDDPEDEEEEMEEEKKDAEDPDPEVEPAEEEPAEEESPEKKEEDEDDPLAGLNLIHRELIKEHLLDDPDAIEALVQAGEDINAQSPKRGMTPLHIASVRNVPAIVKRLLDLKADREIKNWDGHTALDLAKEHNHQDIIEIFEKIAKSKEVKEKWQKGVKKASSSQACAIL